jgi:multidrug efflux pump subunit AcrB
MSQTELERLNGSKARFINVTVSSPAEYIRSGKTPIITVTANFDASDTTTLINLAQTAVKEEFDAGKLADYGLGDDAMRLNIGQESENQDSFKTLALAFPVLLVVIFLLLALEFRSLLQPLLIFLAIPFSVFGVMLGLRLTNNPISFFAALGFFALVGLSIKNTILLTDYANQARHAGASAIDAAVAALEERFRPLFATSATAVVSLIPLALSSPFWQGLAVVLIFGLLSSTFLVVTVFPYYYLGAEYLRIHIKRSHFFTWLFIVAALGFIATKLTNLTVGLAIIPISLVYLLLYKLLHSRFLP